MCDIKVLLPLLAAIIFTNALEQQLPKPATRTKRSPFSNSIFNSVFHNADPSKSLTQKFFEGSRNNDRIIWENDNGNTQKWHATPNQQPVKPKETYWAPKHESPQSTPKPWLPKTEKPILFHEYGVPEANFPKFTTLQEIHPVSEHVVQYGLPRDIVYIPFPEYGPPKEALPQYGLPPVPVPASIVTHIQPDTNNGPPQVITSDLPIITIPDHIVEHNPHEILVWPPYHLSNVQGPNQFITYPAQYVPIANPPPPYIHPQHYVEIPFIQPPHAVAEALPETAAPNLFLEHKPEEIYELPRKHVDLVLPQPESSPGVPEIHVPVYKRKKRSVVVQPILDAVVNTEDVIESSDNRITDTKKHGDSIAGGLISYMIYAISIKRPATSIKNVDPFKIGVTDPVNKYNFLNLTFYVNGNKESMASKILVPQKRHNNVSMQSTPVSSGDESEVSGNKIDTKPKVSLERTKRSPFSNPIFSSVFRNADQSKSLSEKFFEGSHRGDTNPWNDVHDASWTNRGNDAHVNVDVPRVPVLEPLHTHVISNEYGLPKDHPSKPHGHYGIPHKESAKPLICYGPPKIVITKPFKEYGVPKPHQTYGIPNHGIIENYELPKIEISKYFHSFEIPLLPLEIDEFPRTKVPQFNYGYHLPEPIVPIIFQENVISHLSSNPILSNDVSTGQTISYNYHLGQDNTPLFYEVPSEINILPNIPIINPPKSFEPIVIPHKQNVLEPETIPNTLALPIVTPPTHFESVVLHPTVSNTANSPFPSVPRFQYSYDPSHVGRSRKRYSVPNNPQDHNPNVANFQLVEPQHFSISNQNMHAHSYQYTIPSASVSETINQKVHNLKSTQSPIIVQPVQQSIIPNIPQRQLLNVPVLESIENPSLVVPTADAHKLSQPLVIPALKKGIQVETIPNTYTLPIVTPPTYVQGIVSTPTVLNTANSPVPSIPTPQFSHVPNRNAGEPANQSRVSNIQHNLIAKVANVQPIESQHFSIPNQNLHAHSYQYTIPRVLVSETINQKAHNLKTSQGPVIVQPAQQNIIPNIPQRYLSNVPVLKPIEKHNFVAPAADSPNLVQPLVIPATENVLKAETIPSTLTLPTAIPPTGIPRFQFVEVPYQNTKQYSVPNIPHNSIPNVANIQATKSQHFNIPNQNMYAHSYQYAIPSATAESASKNIIPNIPQRQLFNAPNLKPVEGHSLVVPTVDSPKLFQLLSTPPAAIREPVTQIIPNIPQPQIFNVPAPKPQENNGLVVPNMYAPFYQHNVPKFSADETQPAHISQLSVSQSVDKHPEPTVFQNSLPEALKDNIEYNSKFLGKNLIPNSGIKKVYNKVHPGPGSREAVQKSDDVKNIVASFFKKRALGSNKFDNSAEATDGKNVIQQNKLESLNPTKAVLSSDYSNNHNVAISNPITADIQHIPIGETVTHPQDVVPASDNLADYSTLSVKNISTDFPKNKRGYSGYRRNPDIAPEPVITNSVETQDSTRSDIPVNQDTISSGLVLKNIGLRNRTINRGLYRPPNVRIPFSTTETIPISTATENKTVHVRFSTDSPVNVENENLSDKSLVDNTVSENSTLDDTEKRKVLVKVVKRPIYRRKNIVASTLNRERGYTKPDETIVYERNSSEVAQER